MEIETIDKQCSLCGDEATAKIKVRDRSLELCSSCAKELFWVLAHADYVFNEED